MNMSFLSVSSAHGGGRAPSWSYYFRGRVALFHALRAMGVGRGDEVALQAFTCVAVPEAILATGARPIWVDIVSGGVNMDPRSLAGRITPRTKAVVVQHTFGIPADVPALAEAIAGSRARLIEDCCHSFGSALAGRELGTFGCAAFWSFEWGKPVIAGVGGALMVNDPELATAIDATYLSDFRGPSIAREAILRAQALAHRMLYSPRRYWAVRRAYRSVSRAGIITPSFNELPQLGYPGPDYSLRMSSGCASRLPRALARARGEISVRREQAALYLAGIERGAAGRATVPSGSREVLSRFPLLVSNKTALLAAFARANLELADFFSTPVHPLDGNGLRAVGFEVGSCPVAENTAKHLVSLPLGGKVSRTFQEAAVRLVNEHGKC